MHWKAGSKVREYNAKITTEGQEDVTQTYSQEKEDSKL